MGLPGRIRGGDMQATARGLLQIVFLLGLAARGLAEPSDAPFQLITVPGPGRTALAEIVDLDGDGRGDVVTASFTKLPPDQLRKLRVHFQREDGSIPEAPDWVAPLPEGAAAYDFVHGAGGAEEMLFMRRDRVTALSLVGRLPVWRDIPLPGTTLAVAPDERGIDRLRLARDGLASTPLLVVPGLGEIFVTRLDGELLGRLPTQSRANFFVPARPGLLVSDNEADLYFEHPRIDVGDVDGDGRGDLIVSNRHEVLVFLGRETGGFSPKPDQRHALHRISEADHVRATGVARVEARDWNGDGRVDLLVSATQGGLLHAQTRTTLHVNRGGTWDVQKADQTFQVDGGWAGTAFEDVDGDAKLDFVEVRLSLQTLELVKILLTRSIDPELRVYRPAQATPFELKPAITRNLDLGVSFETQRTIGFPPALEDMNSDGRLDLIAPGDGNLLEIHLGAPGPSLAPHPIRQVFDTTGVIRFGDLDHNGLPDFVLHDPRRPGTPVRVGVNRGTLPGTHLPPDLRPRGGAEPAARR
jgi:FG-GAP-like repeat